MASPREPDKLRWPAWHQDTLDTLERINRRLVIGGLIAVAVLFALGVFATIAEVKAANAGRRAGELARAVATQQAVIAVQSNQAQSLAQAVARTQQEIQTQRFNAARDQCEETNRRHRATVKGLDRLFRRQAQNNPRQAAAVGARKRATILLINDFEPLQRDCSARALQITHGGG